MSKLLSDQAISLLRVGDSVKEGPVHNCITAMLVQLTHSALRPTVYKSYYSVPYLLFKSMGIKSKSVDIYAQDPAYLVQANAHVKSITWESGYVWKKALIDYIDSLIAFKKTPTYRQWKRPDLQSNVADILTHLNVLLKHVESDSFPKEKK